MASSSRARPRATSLLLGVPALVLGAVSIAGFFGWIWWPLDLVANFRPHFAVSLTVAALFLFLARRRWMGATVLVAGLLNAAVVVPLFIQPTSSAQPIGGSLSVMTFNVHGLNDRYDEVISQIVELSPDVVFLHESTFLWEDAMEAAGLPYEVLSGRREPLDFGTIALVPEGARFQSFGFATTEPRSVEVVVEVAGEPVRLLGAHPLSPSTERRAGLRDAQMKFAREWAAGSDVRTVVAGDLNATPWSYTFRRLEQVGELLNSQRGYGLELTFPAEAHPVYQVSIDHVLYSEGLVVVERILGRPAGSDHLPVYVELALVTR